MTNKLSIDKVLKISTPILLLVIAASLVLIVLNNLGYIKSNKKQQFEIILIPPVPVSTPTASPSIGSTQQESTLPKGWVPSKTYTGYSCSGQTNGSGNFNSDCQPYTYTVPAHDPNATPETGTLAPEMRQDSNNPFWSGTP